MDSEDKVNAKNKTKRVKREITGEQKQLGEQRSEANRPWKMFFS